MKIALIDPSLFTWPYDIALIEGLRHSGHEVTLFTKHLAEGEQGKGQPGVRELFYPGFQSGWIKALPRPLFLALKGVSHILSHFALRRALKAYKPDIIHFQWAPLPVVDQRLIPALKAIAPVILTVHDSSPFNNNPSAKLQSIGAFTIMQIFDRLIVHTERAEQALARHQLDPLKIARIPHGVLGTGPQIATTEASLRNGEPVNVLLFGKLKPYKGADILIRAVAALPDALRARCRVRIVGKAEMDTEPLFALSKELGVENNIVWDLRFVDDSEMATIFADADIMAMPYRDIDASGVMMVALSIGRPIVASKIGLFAELLEDGTHGRLVPQNDPEALAQALAQLIEDGPLRLQMGQNVRTLGAVIPGWNEIAQRTLALYQQAIG